MASATIKNKKPQGTNPWLTKEDFWNFHYCNYILRVFIP